MSLAVKSVNMAGNEVIIIKAVMAVILPYVPELSERIEKMCRPLGVKTVCRSICTLRSSLVHVKQPREDKKKKGVIYEVPCKDWECVYIGETG